jgi:hypothetical protein
LKIDISLYEFDIMDKFAFTEVELNFGSRPPTGRLRRFSPPLFDPARHTSFIVAGFLTFKPIRAI